MNFIFLYGVRGPLIVRKIIVTFSSSLGRSGADGISGKDGKDGTPGLDGRHGTNGKDGMFLFINLLLYFALQRKAIN